MTYEQLENANKTIKTTDIKGKEYAEVNQRIKVFRMLYPEGSIVTELLSNENGIAVFKATVYSDNMNIIATGHAYEKEGSSFINKTSYIENCETSAVGRALGMCGIGIDTSVASAEEVENAIIQQEADKVITKVQADALLQLIKNKAVEKDEVIAVLSEKGYSKLAEIKVKDYMNIVKHFETFGRD